jgi:quinol monooxygenase YgiN
MLTHVVMIRLKASERDQAADLCQSLVALNGKVPTLRELEAGVDVIGEERSYDVALIARFDDRAGLEAYQTHPDHRAVATAIRAIASSVVVVDYEKGDVS